MPQIYILLKNIKGRSVRCKTLSHQLQVLFILSNCLKLTGIILQEIKSILPIKQVMNLLVIIISQATVTRWRTITSFCYFNRLVYNLLENITSFCNQPPYMTRSTRDCIIQYDGVYQLIIQYNFVQASFDVISLYINNLQGNQKCNRKSTICNVL